MSSRLCPLTKQREAPFSPVEKGASQLHLALRRLLEQLICKILHLLEIAYLYAGLFDGFLYQGRQGIEIILHCGIVLKLLV